MTPKLESVLERLQEAETTEDLSNLVLDLRDIFDIEHVVYHCVKSSGDQYGILTYSHEWEARYVEQNYDRIDPVVLGCFQRFQPVEWKSLDWSPRIVRRFMDEALDSGVGNQGLSVPIRGPNGQFALFTVNHRASDDQWARYTEAHQRDLILVAHYINTKALELDHSASLIAVPPLSPRESDALSLLAIGYSRAHAAETLRISEHTLRAYIESSRLKLGSLNTTHAVATALSRGLIVV